jgi:hypothetical protein
VKTSNLTELFPYIPNIICNKLFPKITSPVLLAGEYQEIGENIYHLLCRGQAQEQT